MEKLCKENLHFLSGHLVLMLVNQGDKKGHLQAVQKEKQEIYTEICKEASRVEWIKGM
jgi:hypothetical protein